MGAINSAWLASHAHRPDMDISGLVAEWEGLRLRKHLRFDPMGVLAGRRLRPLLSAYAEQRLAGYLVQVVDPAEELLPFDGRVRFAGLEADGEMLVPRVDRLRGAYGERFQAHRAALADLARQLGWTFVVHRTDHAPQPALLALYQALTQTHGGEP